MLLSAPRESELSQLAARFDTDKGVGFTGVYSALLTPRRHERLRLLEIGLYNGGSLELWRAFCPNAELFGIDIDPRCLAYEQTVPGATVRLLDQANPAQLAAFLDEVGGGFDLVIDDGGHQMHQQIVSFEVLWPHVVPGGAYVVEDLGTSYWAEYGGGGLGRDGTMVAHAKRLVDSVNYWDASPQRAVETGRLVTVSEAEHARLRPDVASVHFFSGMAVVVKAG